MKSAGAGQDVDIVLTTREFVRMIRAEHINTRFLKEQAFVLLWEKAPVPE